ncbi:uncharacterized protein TNCV_3929221 [Trichonephila clavipes]|nr:uncharacterized protein TNCV_3929221 [Trichonephila clavipes]
MDSRSSIQHLAELWRHGDRTTTSVVLLLNSLSTNVKIFFQWVPSHGNVFENEIADGLALAGSHKDSMHSGYLSFSEIATRIKKSSRRDQTTLAEGLEVDILELNGTWWVLKLSHLVQVTICGRGSRVV